jgi:hypothetical protein
MLVRERPVWLKSESLAEKPAPETDDAFYDVIPPSLKGGIGRLDYKVDFAGARYYTSSLSACVHLPYCTICEEDLRSNTRKSRM